LYKNTRGHKFFDLGHQKVIGRFSWEYGFKIELLSMKGMGCGVMQVMVLD
jgi:hypothetical protein